MVLGRVRELITLFISFHTIRILETKPELARDKHASVLTALQVAIVDRKPANINPIRPKSDKLQAHGSTPLHYACLVGNMKIVEVLLRNGADWTISDGNDLLPENYAGVNGDSKMQEFKRLCEKENSTREEEESIRVKEKAELERLKREELEREKEKAESERLKREELEREEERAESERLERTELEREKETAELYRLMREDLEREEEKAESDRLKKEEDLRRRSRKWLPFSLRPIVLRNLPTSQLRWRISLEPRSSDRGVQFGLSHLPSGCVRMAGSILTVPSLCSSLEALE